MGVREGGSPTQQRLGFDYDEGHAEQGLTALAGIPVLLQAFRSLDLPRSVARHLSIKQRQRGLDEASYVESFVILNAAGGECLDDFAHLRQDGVRELIGHDLPSPEAARKFCTSFTMSGGSSKPSSACYRVRSVTFRRKARRWKDWVRSTPIWCVSWRGAKSRRRWRRSIWTAP